MRDPRTVQQRIIERAAGNFGALAVLTEAFDRGTVIGLSLLALVERDDLKGAEIWDLSKLAGRDPRRTMGLIEYGRWTEDVRRAHAGDLSPEGRLDAAGRITEELNRLEGFVWPDPLRLAVEEREAELALLAASFGKERQ